MAGRPGRRGAAGGEGGGLQELAAGHAPSHAGAGRSGPAACDHRGMSRRDLAHVMTALHDLTGGRAGAAVDLAAIDEAIGRSRRDMRTPLNLADLAADGLVTSPSDGVWALTDDGVAWIRRDRELSGR